MRTEVDNLRINIGLDNNYDGRSLAWALDFPGCFAFGSEASEAILRVPEALLRYKEWVDSHLPNSWMKDLADFDIHLEESFDSPSINENYGVDEKGSVVQTRLPYDWKPLTSEDIRRGLLILEWSRADLLELTAGLSPAHLEYEIEGERWNIARVLSHIANSEHWYLTRLGLIEISQQDLPSDLFERLHYVRQRLTAALPQLAGVQKVVVVDGEFWSPRKLLRRTAGHEIDHIDHIFKLVARL